MQHVGMTVTSVPTAGPKVDAALQYEDDICIASWRKLDFLPDCLRLEPAGHADDRAPNWHTSGDFPGTPRSAIEGFTLPPGLSVGVCNGHGAGSKSSSNRIAAGHVQRRFLCLRSKTYAQ